MLSKARLGDVERWWPNPRIWLAEGYPAVKLDPIESLDILR